MRDSKLSAVLGEARHGRTASFAFHPLYGAATVLYMLGITLMSSIPRDSTPRYAIFEQGLNLGHVPLFAGLTFLLIKTVAPKQRGLLATGVCAWAGTLLVAFAALDEWHQAFVPGRSASIIDLLLDVMGIGTVLLFYRLSALVLEKS